MSVNKLSDKQLIDRHYFKCSNMPKNRGLFELPQSVLSCDIHELQLMQMCYFLE